MKNKRLLSIAALFVMSTPLMAASLPRESAVPGGSALVNLGPGNVPAPRVRFDGNRVKVQPHEGHWWAIVGLPLATSPGKQNIQVTPAEGTQLSIDFTVEPKSYTEQRLTRSRSRSASRAR